MGRFNSQSLYPKWPLLMAKKTSKQPPNAQNLFCVLHLICILAIEFNGLVSKQGWLFLQLVLFLYAQGTLQFISSKRQFQFAAVHHVGCSQKQ